MDNLFEPPPVYILPVSLGADIRVLFRNRVPGSDPVAYEDFPDGTEVSLVIGKPGAIVATGDGVIDGSDALCVIASEVADVLKTGALWRCVISINGNDRVPLNGMVRRYDGA